MSALALSISYKLSLEHCLPSHLWMVVLMSPYLSSVGVARLTGSGTMCSRGVSTGTLAKLLTYAQGRGEYIAGQTCLVQTDDAER